MNGLHLGGTFWVFDDHSKCFTKLFLTWTQENVWRFGSRHSPDFAFHAGDCPRQTRSKNLQSILLCRGRACRRQDGIITLLRKMFRVFLGFLHSLTSSAPPEKFRKMPRLQCHDGKQLWSYIHPFIHTTLHIRVAKAFLVVNVYCAIAVHTLLPNK